jgi:hypothetical protein
MTIEELRDDIVMGIFDAATREAACELDTLLKELDGMVNKYSKRLESIKEKDFNENLPAPLPPPRIPDEEYRRLLEA